MKKTYIFEWEPQRVEIDAYSEEEARALLDGQGFMVDDATLIDVWSAEQNDEGMCSHETSAE